MVVTQKSRFFLITYLHIYIVNLLCYIIIIILRIVRSLRNGQITIPADFREKLGITQASMLQLTLVDGELRVKPVEVKERQQGALWLRDLSDYFMPVREEGQKRGYTEKEINDAIDSAIVAVRKKHEGHS